MEEARFAAVRIENDNIHAAGDDEIAVLTKSKARYGVGERPFAITPGLERCGPHRPAENIAPEKHLSPLVPDRGFRKCAHRVAKKFRLRHGKRVSGVCRIHDARTVEKNAAELFEVVLMVLENL